MFWDQIQESQAIHAFRKGTGRSGIMFPLYLFLAEAEAGIIFEEEKKTKDREKLIKAKQAETDYYFDKEIEILKLQGKFKENNKGEKDD